MTGPARPAIIERLVVPCTATNAAETIADVATRSSTEVIAVAIDIGQGVPLEALRDSALAAGAIRCHAFDRRERLATNFLWPALRTGAIGLAGEPLVTALSAPCIAEAVVEVARLEAATAVVAAAPTPRESRRLMAALRDLAPDLGVVTAGRVTPAADERNVWGVVQALAGDTDGAAPAAGTRAGAASVLVTIEKGLPVALNRVPMPPVEIIDSLATIARAQCVPAVLRHDDSGAARQRWRVQAPAAESLHQAWAAVVERTLNHDEMDCAAEAAETYARLVRDGHWFTRLRGGIDAFAAHVFDTVSGEVRVTMRQGRIEVEA